MMASEIAYFLISAVATCSLLAAMHYFLSSVIAPAYFLSFCKRMEKSRYGMLHIGLVVLASAVGAYGAVSTLLFWLPNSFGIHSSDGHFITVRMFLAILLSFPAWNIASVFYGYAQDSVRVKDLEKKSTELEQQLLLARQELSAHRSNSTEFRKP